MSQYVVQVVPDRFEESKEKEKKSSQSPQSSKFIRRPTRGIILKEETFATLRVTKGNGDRVLVIDAGSQFRDKDGWRAVDKDGKHLNDTYSNFLLQHIQEERAEKAQILETFGEPYIFLYGERPRTISFSGVLINTFDFNWEAEWWENYDLYLRGTRCVENDARVFLQFDQTLVGGYILGASASKDSQNQNVIQLGFQMFVTTYTTLTQIGKAKANPRQKTENDLSYTGDKSEQDLSASYRPERYDPDQQKGADIPPGGVAFVSTADSIPDASGSGSVQEPGLFDSLGDVAKNAWEYTSSITEKKNAYTNPPLSPLGGSEMFGADLNVVGNEGVVSGYLQSSLQMPDSSKVDGALKGVDSWLPQAGFVSSGKTMKLPFGFAGIAAFDADMNVKLSPVPNVRTTTVGYTIFQDNTDEYVGRDDHYGTAINPMGQAMRIAIGGQVNDAKSAADATKRIEQMWKDAGYTTNDKAFGGVANTVANWEVSSGLNSLMSTAGDFASALGVDVQTLAVGGAVVGAVAPVVGAVPGADAVALTALGGLSTDSAMTRSERILPFNPT